MTRSRKKHPGGGIAMAESDKPYKTSEHKRERARMRAIVNRWKNDPEVKAALHRKEFGNPYKSPKDGKQYCTDHDDKWMRK